MGEGKKGTPRTNGERERIEWKEQQEAMERERIERQEARDDMMKMIGIAVSQFANAIGNGDGSNNFSAVFSPRQAPRFEGANGETIALPPAPASSDEDEEIPPRATKKRIG